MTKEQRKALRIKIIEAVSAMTADGSNRDSVVTICGHRIERRLVYAGGSQWCGCGRDWDAVETAWAWVIDGQWLLSAPQNMFGFDGHNMIERQTPYYLADGYDEQTTPVHDGRDPLNKTPGKVLIAIGKGLVEARQVADAAKEQEEAEAGAVLAAL